MSNYQIIGIHGLANKPPESQLKEWWRKSIIEGLMRNEGRTRGNGSLAIDIVYWADWNYSNPISENENKEPYIEAEGSGSLPEYEENFWDELRADASDLFDTPLDWMKRSFGIDALAGKILEAKLEDLSLYYEDEAKRNDLIRRLKNKILENREKRIMLIAHSMGSIVAYDVLRRLGRDDPNLRIDHFVTIGSPLGLPHVKYRIWEENDLVRTPSIVQRWTNLADKKDPVAVDISLAGDYKANDFGVKVKDDLVINGYKNGEGNKNAHKSYGYLRTPELSKLIRGFI